MAGQRVCAGEALHAVGQVLVGLGVTGDLPDERHGAIEPQPEERRERRLRRRRHLEDDDAPAGTHDPRHLAQALVEVAEVPGPESDGRGVEAVRVVLQLEGVAPFEAQARILAARELEHALGEVRADDLALRADALLQLDRQVARTAGDVEDPVARPDRGQIRRPGAPLVVQPRGHHGVHAVVEPRDAVEHRADLRLLQGPRGGPAHRGYFYSSFN
jgi:hypothetical protein